jgi:stage II sporulation protein D (peptidoglycan lytic transglycosylase)
MSMRRLPLLSALVVCLAAPCALRAQSFDVRIYAADPPASITISAAQGAYAWRTCATCADQTASGAVVSVTASGLAVATAPSAVPQPAADLYVAGDYVLHPPAGADAPPFAANFPLHIRALDGRLLITVTMPIEKYVAGVLAAESGDFKQSESTKAMAVAIRTYALRFRGKHAAEGFDFCDTTHCQAMSWNAVTPRIAQAVSATEGQTLDYGGAPAETYYHQNSGGIIAAASESWPDNDAPYLAMHADPYCIAAGVLKWESAIPVADIDRALRAAGLSLPSHWKTLEVDSRTASGRTQRLKLAGGSPPEVPLSASTLRFAVNRSLGWNKIRSDLYDIRNDGGRVYFSGRGSGHGVGLCQAGAEEMAREGKSYLDILNFYYPGTQLVTARAPNWQELSSERVDLLTTNPQSDSAILAIAGRVLKDDEQAIGWQLPFRPQLQIFATMDAYRDTTGEPGWVAASVRGHTIRLQPLIELQRRSIVESTLRHELFHLLVESLAKSGTPVWFREGIVLYLSNPGGAPASDPAMTDAQMEAAFLHPASREDQAAAYDAAQRRVAVLIQDRGKEAVLGWLSAGIPAEVLSERAQ